jgi:type I site-specific restriction-modification system R (restriction) subunit
MNLGFDYEELEASLNFAKIKNWLEDDLHKRLFHVLTLESYINDPGNDTKRLMVITSEHLDPTAFVLTLQKMRENGGSGKNISDYMVLAILHLCSMTEKQTRKETLEFIKSKEEVLDILKPALNLDVGLEEIKKFLRNDKNRAYILKIFKAHERLKGENEEIDKLICKSFEDACNDGTLENKIETGYTGGGVWKAITEIIRSFIQMRGGKDVTDEDLNNV